jgi:hypothetical protein
MNSFTHTIAFHGSVVDREPVKQVKPLHCDFNSLSPTTTTTTTFTPPPLQRYNHVGEINRIHWREFHEDGVRVPGLSVQGRIGAVVYPLDMQAQMRWLALNSLPID